MKRRHQSLTLTLAFVATGVFSAAMASQAAESDASEKSAASKVDTLAIRSLKCSGNRVFPMPTLPDSLSKGENPFSADKLLDKIPAPTSRQLREQLADWTTILPDSSGVYHLSIGKEDGSLAMNRFAAHIRPEAFFSGKLSVKTSGAFKAYVNGKQVATKAAIDSVAKEGSGKFSLQPMEDADISIVLLNDSGAKSKASEDGDATLIVEIIPDKESQNVTISQGIDEKGRYNLFTTRIGTRIEDAVISPDGRFVMLSQSFCENGVDTDNTLFVEETASGKIVAENLPAGTKWLPSRDATLYYNDKSSDGTFAIRLIEVPSMRRSVLAENLPLAAASGYEMSPAGDFILYANTIKGEADKGVMGRLKSPDDRMPGNRNRHYISIVDFADGLERPLTWGGPSTYPLDISRDGKRLLYYTLRETPDQFPFYDVKLVDMDIRTLKADTIPGIDSSITEACYSPDGKKILVLAGPNAFGGIGLNCGGCEWGNDFDIQAYLFDKESGAVKAMSRDFDPSIMTGTVWSPTDNKIYFRAQAGFNIFIYSLNPADGKITQLPVDADYVRNYSVATRKGSEIAYTGMSYNYAGRAYLLNPRSGKGRMIADPLAETLAEVQLGDWERWNFTASDGTQIEGTVTFPPDFDPAKKYPLIVYYYGGTTPCTLTNHSPYSPPLFASRGYIVYTINPSGTIGYGQEFSSRHVNAWGERTADDIIEGTKRLCAERPYIDSSKIGCIGASYGGFMTQLLQTKTDIFAAAVSHAGISNIASYWGEGYWGYTYNAVAAARSYPWNNPSLFTEHSPLFNADKIHTPLLLLHGSVDTNVPIGESIQLYNALKILGREVEFITVDGQNHIIMDFEKRKEWHATIMAWFEKWLKGDSRWWDSIYK